MQNEELVKRFTVIGLAIVLIAVLIIDAISISIFMNCLFTKCEVPVIFIGLCILRQVIWGFMDVRGCMRSIKDVLKGDKKNGQKKL